MVDGFLAARRNAYGEQTEGQEAQEFPGKGTNTDHLEINDRRTDDIEDAREERSELDKA